MAQLNSDTLLLIAEFISPNPLRFLELAQVSKVFYQAFTSDRVWKYLNPYGVSSNIADNFRQIISNQDHYRRIRFSWRGDEVFVHPNLELYCALGIALRPTELPVTYDQELPSNRQLYWCAVNINGHALKVVPDELVFDDELIEIAVHRHPEVLGHVLDIHPFVEKDWVLMAIQRYKILYPNTGGDMETCHWFPELNHQLYSDREVALALVSYCGHLIHKLPSELKDDRCILLEAAKTHSDVLQHTRLMEDRQVVMTVVERDGGCLELAESFQDDDEVVMCAVKNKGAALLFASARLRDNEEIVLQAVCQAGYSYMYASERLKGSRSIALAAMKNDVSVWEYVPIELRDDPDLWAIFLGSS